MKLHVYKALGEKKKEKEIMHLFVCLAHCRDSSASSFSPP